MQETERIEFKCQVTDDIAKEVVAFANSGGGTIYIGVADDGTSVGLTDFDAEYTRLTNIVRDAIVPDVTVFVHYTRSRVRNFCKNFPVISVFSPQKEGKMGAIFRQKKPYLPPFPPLAELFAEPKTDRKKFV